MTAIRKMWGTANPFIYTILVVPDFKSGLMSMISATDVSILCEIAAIPMTNREMSIHLNPMRDLPGVVRIYSRMRSLGLHDHPHKHRHL